MTGSLLRKDDSSFYDIDFLGISSIISTWVGSLVNRDTEEKSSTDDEDDNRRDKTELDKDENSRNGNFDGSVLSENDDVTRNPRRPKDVKFTLGFKDIEETFRIRW